jgi:hypothetical protein
MHRCGWAKVKTADGTARGIGRGANQFPVSFPEFPASYLKTAAVMRKIQQICGLGFDFPQFRANSLPGGAQAGQIPANPPDSQPRAKNFPAIRES